MAKLPLFLRLRLEVKFFLTIMVLVISLISAVLYLVYSQQERSILAEVEARANDLATVLAFSGVRANLEGNYLGLQELVDSIKNRNDVRQAMFLDLEGKVLAHNYAAERDKVYTDSLTQKILHADSCLSVINYYLFEKEKVVDVATPVIVSGQKIAVARVIISLNTAERAIQSMTKQILVLGSVSVLVVLVLVALFSRSVTQPLRKLHGEARQISLGNRDIQIAVTAQDEIGTLQRALKTMVEEVRLQSRLSALGATTANLAHEIRTPLTVITRYANELIRQTGAPELGAKLLNEINRLHDLVEQLLQFSQKRKLVRSRTCLNDLIGQALYLLDGPIQERRIRVHPDLQPQPIIAVDKNLLQSVFTNLITNAIEAMGEEGGLHLQTKLLPAQLNGHNGYAGNGKLTPSPDQQNAGEPAVPRPKVHDWLKVLRKLQRPFLVESGTPAHHAHLANLPIDQQAIMITIRDTGCGIPQALMDRLFLPFFTTKRNGNGLGLALSHKIIQEHGGTITVESQEGQGTTFTIMLPA
jgi:signal transduction histidine kinase